MEIELEMMESRMVELEKEIKKLRAERIGLKLARYHKLHAIYGRRLATMENEYRFLERYVQRNEAE